MSYGTARSRRWLGALAGLVCLLFVAAPATAAPPTRAAALEAYQSVLDAQRVPSGWTGSVPGCVVGTESDASLNATRHTVNTLRDFAGIAPVRFDPELNQKALAAALMMLAAQDLNHFPDETWPCYSTAGKDAAGNSNLAIGYFGASAMVGYVDDESAPTLGHRRWLLNPGAQTFGSGSTPGSNALWVFGEEAPVEPGTVVAWPPPGWVPWQWVFNRWSVEVIGADPITDPTVKVSVDGRAVDVNAVESLNRMYGPGEAVSWRVALPAAAQQADRRIDVSIRGMRVGGQPFPIDYEVRAFDPAGSGVTSGCDRAKQRLAKAKRKLRRLKRADAKRRRIKQAKKRVRKAKAARREACA